MHYSVAKLTNRLLLDAELAEQVRHCLNVELAEQTMVNPSTGFPPFTVGLNDPNCFVRLFKN